MKQMTLADHVAHAKVEGWALIPGVFDPVVLERIEPALETPPAIIAFFRTHPDVLDVAHALMGKWLLDTGESRVNHGVAAEDIYTDWHADVPWALNPVDSLLPAWRFAVYFRDYSSHSGGLKVVPGSHLGPCQKKPGTRGVAVLSRPGDLVVWNLRTIHAAGADNNSLPVAHPRNAVFFDWAAPHKDVRRYIHWRKKLAAQRAKREAA